MKRLGDLVVVLAAVNDGKVNLVVKASKAAVAAGAHAGKVIKEAAKLVGGGGGGRPDMAQRARGISASPSVQRKRRFRLHWKGLKD